MQTYVNYLGQEGDPGHQEEENLDLVPEKGRGHQGDEGHDHDQGAIGCLPLCFFYENFRSHILFIQIVITFIGHHITEVERF